MATPPPATELWCKQPRNPLRYRGWWQHGNAAVKNPPATLLAVLGGEGERASLVSSSGVGWTGTLPGSEGTGIAVFYQLAAAAQ